MLRSQIVVWERERRLAPLLRDLAAAERWAMREPGQVDVCWSHLRQLTPTVLVVHVPRPSDFELDLIQRVAAECPHVGIVAAGAVTDADTVAGLCWDLGVDFALFTPLSRDLLPDIVRGLMQRASTELPHA